MNGGKKKIRKAKKQMGKTARQAGKTIKRGQKMAAKGSKEMGKAIKMQAKRTSKGGTPTTRSRIKADDAAVKMISGSKTAAAAKPKAKPKRKVYRNAPNIEYGKTPGAKKYLTPKGKPTNRKR